MNEDPRSILDRTHYLGSRGSRARLVYTDAHGVIVFSGPASRRLPRTWLELSRWCILPGGVGSVQWRSALRWVRQRAPACTTIVSYSDPSVGHTGALYRACGWRWAPTWHVLRPPPTGNGMRGGRRQSPTHRWVYLLALDDARGDALALRDPTLARRWPRAGYREPVWRRGVPVLTTEDAQAFRRWTEAMRSG